MAQLDALFTPADHEAVNRAVQQAEQRTCAEIIPVVASSSGRYDRSEDIVGLWLAVMCVSLVWKFYPAVQDADHSWATPSPVWELAAYVAAIVVGFVAGAITASRVSGLRHLFTPKAQMRDEVGMRARAVFFDQRVHHTAGSSGVLLYVSLLERMAMVLADQSIVDKLGQAQLDELCREFTLRLQVGTPASAICETIHSVGERLAKVLPRSAGDVNELADALVVLG